MPQVYDVDFLIWHFSYIIFGLSHNALNYNLFNIYCVIFFFHQLFCHAFEIHEADVVEIQLFHFVFDVDVEVHMNVCRCYLFVADVTDYLFHSFLLRSLRSLIPGL